MMNATLKIENPVEYFTALDYRRIPGVIETWVSETFSDEGIPTFTFARKAGKNLFKITELAR